ncbi:DUF892 family protein [Chryseolinea sp. T2]|uniref:DUF892 family protein n=1 Tax=Chryseolinea sp. T2 TaxID=3129255 RepID=UPI0030788282
MIFQIAEDCPATESPAEKSPAHHVFSETLRELYWSKNHLMRTLLKLENTALNGQLKRTIRDYFEVNRSHAYSIEHLFELLDENPEGRHCNQTDTSCGNALALLSSRTEGKDKMIRSSLIEFYAQELTSLDYLFTLALSMSRLDLARIISEIQRKTRTSFEFSFPTATATTVVAA